MIAKTTRKEKGQWHRILQRCKLSSAVVQENSSLTVPEMETALLGRTSAV